jgi:hypothetical protein
MKNQKNKKIQQKSVNRARNTNGNGNKSRPPPRNVFPSRGGNGNGPRISAPLAGARQQSTRDPSISTRSNGTICRVVHRELIDTMNSSGALFQVLKRYRCNPGSTLTFPWLSTIANSWETYRFKRLSFQSIARCPTTTSGSFLLSPDYDAQDGAPNTEAQMSQMKGTQEGSPWQDITLNLDPASMNRLYKSHVTMDDSRFSTTTQDEKTIDVAQVFAGCDMDAAVKISKLWVDYDVELFTPQPPQLPLDSGGATMFVPSTSSPPTAVGQKYGNSVANTVVQQSPVNPLIQVVDNSTFASNDLVKMLRDWTGNIEWTYNTSTANAFGVASPPNLFKNGVAIPILGNVQELAVANGQNGATYNTLRQIVAVALKAGDVIGLNPAAGILVNPAAQVTSGMTFGANSNLF